jgi:hypothetical protein
MTTKRDSKSNRPTYQKFDPSVTPRPGRAEQQQADAAIAQFRAYYEERRGEGISPKEAFDAWLLTPAGGNATPLARAEVERAANKLTLTWQMNRGAR